YAANTLWALGRPARKALDRLFALLDDPSPLVRGRSIGAVATIDPEDARLVPALSKAAREGDAETRAMAIQFLGDGHAGAAGVDSLLETASRDAEVPVRSAAAGYLHKNGPAALA